MSETFTLRLDMYQRAFMKELSNRQNEMNMDRSKLPEVANKALIQMEKIGVIQIIPIPNSTMVRHKLTAMGISIVDAMKKGEV